MNRHQPSPSLDSSWDRRPRPRAPPAITVPPPDYPIEASRFSPESPPIPRPSHKRSHSAWTNTNTLKSDASPPKDPELGRVSSPHAPHFRERFTKLFFDIRMPRIREPELIPMQHPPLQSWPPLEKHQHRCCERCEKKKKRDRLLLVLLIVFLLYLLGNTVFLNVRVLNMAPQSSSPPAASASPTSMASSGVLSADAQQCISQYNLNAPTDPQSYPCSTCYPVLSAVPSNFSDGNAQDAQTIANAVQFCSLRSVFESASGDGQTGLANGGWAKDVRFCAWSGVKCDGFGRVASLQLTFPSVPASIPTELGGLTGLTSLQVIGDTNIPAGSLPSSFAQLTAITSLDLESTALTSIDDTLFSSLSKVSTLTLGAGGQLWARVPEQLRGRWRERDQLWIVGHCAVSGVARREGDWWTFGRPEGGAGARRSERAGRGEDDEGGEGDGSKKGERARKRTPERTREAASEDTCGASSAAGKDLPDGFVDSASSEGHKSIGGS